MLFSQAEMEVLSEDSILECQICFNYYSPRRRPKLLDCRHTCCSVCLTQMRMGQRDVRCPWCRAITRLPAGIPISQLPDDPALIAAIAFPRERAAVFVRVPGDGCYALPLPVAEDRALLSGGSGRRLLSGDQQKGVAVVMMSEQEGDSGEAERQGVAEKGSAWSGVCTVLLVACVLLFLLGIVLHNMSCISKRLTVISCS